MERKNERKKRSKKYNKNKIQWISNSLISISYIEIISAIWLNRWTMIKWKESTEINFETTTTTNEKLTAKHEFNKNRKKKRKKKKNKNKKNELLFLPYLKYFINCKSCAVGREAGSLHVRRETASCNGTGTRGSILCTDSSSWKLR